jgi:hypothetical protein
MAYVRSVEETKEFLEKIYVCMICDFRDVAFMMIIWAIVGVLLDMWLYKRVRATVQGAGSHSTPQV